MSLSSGALLLWQSGFLPQEFLAMNFLPFIHSGCLLIANSNLPPEFRLQSLCSQLSAPTVNWQTHVPLLGVQGFGTDHLCRYHSVLSAADQLFHPSIASDAPLCPKWFPHQWVGFPGFRSLSYTSTRGLDPVLLLLLSFSLLSSGWISFRIDWFYTFGVQVTSKSLLQHHSSKASILWHSAFFIVQLSHLYVTTGKTIALTIQTFWQIDVSAF